MRLLLPLILMFAAAPLVTNAKDTPQDACLELQSEQIRLGLTGKNLANANTTRTPAGGAYRPFKIKACDHGGCSGVLEDAPVLKYLPNHPDANKEGYVAFPNIDTKSEFSQFSMTAKKLKLLAASKACGAKVVEEKNGESFIIRYNNTATSKVKEDLVSLDKNHRVVSWMRQDADGAATTLKFGKDGTVVSKSVNE